PFEAARRVYLVHAAETMNEDAADALLKDLEEPPAYAVIVLVADDLGPLPETIRSRCQLVPFTRLSERAVREEIAVRAPGLEPAVVHADRLAVLAEDATTDRLAAAERACEIVRETWRAFEEFNLSPPLALEALFVRLRKELGAIPTLA